MTAILSNAPAIGQNWPQSSLVWGQPSGQGDFQNIVSPLGGPLQGVQMLGECELAGLIEPKIPLQIVAPQIWDFGAKLRAQIEVLAPELKRAMHLETGFCDEDCAEMVDATLQFLKEFPDFLDFWQQNSPVLNYQGENGARGISLSRQPWGTVAVILPQNAFLLVAVTCLMNALATGNRVILRVPLGSARSGALLALAIANCGEMAREICVVNARAPQFLKTLFEAPDSILVHYMGGSNRAAELASESFNAGQPLVADGSGNTWVWVGENANVDKAAQILTRGATRYNGQTCTSINGALIHPQIYQQLREKLIENWRDLTEIGPLFDEKQAIWCENQIQSSGGQILVGGTRKSNLLAPTLVENSDFNSALVSEGIFGPALWIAAETAEQFCDLWRKNQHPLCAGILAPDTQENWWARRLRNLARLVVNGDPSVEFLHEPWGGYPRSGLNTVSAWAQKYQRVVQIDAAI